MITEKYWSCVFVLTIPGEYMFIKIEAKTQFLYCIILHYNISYLLHGKFNTSWFTVVVNKGKNCNIYFPEWKQSSIIYAGNNYTFHFSTRSRPGYTVLKEVRKNRIMQKITYEQNAGCRKETGRKCYKKLLYQTCIS